MTRIIRAALLICGLMGLLPGLAGAQTATGLSPEQYDTLVSAITRSVLIELGKAPAAPVATPESSPAPTSPMMAAAPVGLNAADALLARMQAVIAAIPDFAQVTGRAFARLDASAQGGWTTTGFLMRLTLVLAAALAVEFGLRLALRPVRIRLAMHLNTPRALIWLLALLLAEVVAVAGLWAVLRGAGGRVHPVGPDQAHFLTLALTLLLAWRTYLLPVRAWLRPQASIARIVPLENADAIAVYRRIALVLLIILAIEALFRYLLAGTTVSPDAIAAGGLLANVIITATAVTGMVRSRVAVAGWFASMVPPGGMISGMKLAMARQWLWFGIGVFTVFSLAQARGILMSRFNVADGIELTLVLILGLVFFETLLDYLARRHAPDAAGVDTAMHVVTRCIAVAVRVLVVLVVVEAWAVHVLAMMAPAEWTQLRRGVTTAGLVVYTAYVLWQVSRYQIDRYMAVHPVAGGFGDDEKAPTTASRLRTLMPVFRAALAAVILVLTVLIVLSELGVNTAPLIAGASVFGLAISFGSQALVRDVVSGIFFLADDAFRVGEYIDTGKVKGTVEGFTIRSLRLRHQNGQVHTMPFGQLGSITNFSRDWTTVKFNLRVARGTDLELLRKTVKKIGLEMAEDPEFKDEFLEPLKLQGIADIADNALIVRFKFTVRPNTPSLIQRQAVRRMYLAFAEKGIEFAQPTMSINTLGGGPAPDQATLTAVALASQTAARATPEILPSP